MKVFVTGASGWIGSAAVAELLGHGHEVVGLARSDESAARLEEAGAGVFRGSLDEPEGLAKAAADADGVLHLAFNHELAFGANDFVTAAAADRRAVEAMAGAIAGTDKPLALAAGTAGLTLGRVATENDGMVPAPAIAANPVSLRQATSLLALSLRGIGIRSSVLRFSPTVHGDGDHGFIAMMVGAARQQGVAAYVGDGKSRWSAVHRSDAGSLARLAIESAPAGSVLHAVAEEGVPMHSIAEAIGKGLGVPVKSIAPEEASAHFGPFGHFISLDSPASSAITRQLLDWQPSGPTLLEDLAAGHYFKES